MSKGCRFWTDKTFRNWTTSQSLPSLRVVGTFGYMPPEYARYGEVSPKVDVYAFGIVMYELLSAKEAIVRSTEFADAQGLAYLRDSAGLATQNNELEIRLQAMEQQAQLRDATTYPSSFKTSARGAAQSTSSDEKPVYFRGYKQRLGHLFTWCYPGPCYWSYNMVVRQRDTTYLFLSVGLFLLHDHLTMFAVEECAVTSGADDRAMGLRVCGCGWFGAYCLREPARCLLDSAEVEFSYDANTALMSVDLPVLEQELYRWTLEIVV